jgi:hypothetical protein
MRQNATLPGRADSGYAADAEGEMTWEPATKEEVLIAIESEWSMWTLRAPELAVRLNGYFIDPYPARFERFGQIEKAFVVGRNSHNVVFYEDVEEIFGIAEERDGFLHHTACYDNLMLTMRELDRLEGLGIAQG